MRNSLVGGVLAVLVVIGLIAAWGSFFVVQQTEQAIVVRLGRPIGDVRQPGLNLKVPIIDTVIALDTRILDLDLAAQEVIASDQKRLVVDAFARYRITDPLLFYQRVGAVEQANNRLSTFVNSSLRRVLGESTFQQVVRDIRPQLMARIRDQVNREASGLGMTVVDVKIRRADLPEQNSQAIYSRMQTERKREADEIRAEGKEQAQIIRSRADRDVQVIQADANRQAEIIRGEGDARRNAIYAEAYGADRDFFAFYRSMQAYETGLKPGETRLLLSPDSQFFRYFENPLGPATGAPAPAAPATGTTGPAAGDAPATP